MEEKKRRNYRNLLPSLGRHKVTLSGDLGEQLIKTADSGGEKRGTEVTQDPEDHLSRRIYIFRLNVPCHIECSL